VVACKRETPTRRVKCLDGLNGETLHKKGPKPGRRKRPPVYVDTPAGYGRTEQPMRWLKR